MARRVVLVRCIDNRFSLREDGRNLIDEFCREHNFQPFSVTSAGGVRDLVRPAGPGFDQHILRNIGVGVSNGGSAIVFMNHEDCHDYNMPDIAEERKLHAHDLLGASSVVAPCFPKVPIFPFMGCLEKKSQKDFRFLTLEEFINHKLRP